MCVHPQMLKRHIRASSGMCATNKPQESLSDQCCTLCKDRVQRKQTSTITTELRAWIAMEPNQAPSMCQQ